MEFRILGPAELWSAGQRHHLGAVRIQGLLAMLLLAPRTIVPVDILIGRLWDDRPPPKARESLAVYAARLRAALRQAVGDSVHLTGRASGYVLDVDPEDVDLHQFRRLRRQADALIASGDQEHAALLLREADTLWRGQALAGLRGDWMARMRDSLEEERRAAIRQRISAELELGRHADLVSELRGLLAQYPLDEALVAHQMTALYGSGRPADALSLYQDTRRLLIDEQGTEPGILLSELQQRILRRDPDLDQSAAGRRASMLPGPDTLPPRAPDFIGRREELARLANGQGNGPQVFVIEGTAGVGKSAFAAQAAQMLADRYPDGVLYLNLHSYDPGSPALDADEAVSRLLAMMGVPAMQVPEGFGERIALWRAQMSRRRAIVILDDAARPDQVEPLLPTAGQCLMLITARHPLPDLSAARILVLDALASDEAAALFTRVAGPGMPSDDARVSAAVELCGHLPLAIHLAAGRLAQASPPTLGDLVGELAQAPVRLGHVGEASPQVRSAFDSSYRALQPRQQRFFRLLGANPCPHVSLHGAAALTGSTPLEAEEALAALHDHRLLIRTSTGQYRFHDLIRGFAAARGEDLDKPAERRLAIGRLLDYYLSMADRADQVLHPFRHRIAVTIATQPLSGPALRTEEDAAAWLNLEWRNILRAALHAGRHGWTRQCADLIHTLAGYVEIRGYWGEAMAAHTLALEACRDIADPGRIAQAALELSIVSQQTGRGEAALTLAEEAADIYRSAGDPRGLAEALDHIGLVHQRAGQSQKALAYFREARTLYEGAGDVHGLANTLSHAGIACWQLGYFPDALSHEGQALSHYRDVHDTRGEGKVLHNLGKMHLVGGSVQQALDCFYASLDIFNLIDGAQNQAILHQQIGNVHGEKGNYEMALAAYRRSLAIYRDIGDLPNEADLLNDIGDTYLRAELYDEALIHYEQARLTAREVGNLAEHAAALRGIGDVRRADGRHGEALEWYRGALNLAKQIGDPYQEALILEGAAEAELGSHRLYEARIVLRQALEIYDRLGVPQAEATRLRLDSMHPAIGSGTLAGGAPASGPRPCLAAVRSG